MNSKPPEVRAPETGEPSSRVAITRIVIWSLVALAVLLGLYLYFRYGASVTPVLSLPS